MGSRLAIVHCPILPDAFLNTLNSTHRIFADGWAGSLSLLRGWSAADVLFGVTRCSASALPSTPRRQRAAYGRPDGFSRVLQLESIRSVPRRQDRDREQASGRNPAPGRPGDVVRTGSSGMCAGTRVPLARQDSREMALFWRACLQAHRVRRQLMHVRPRRELLAILVPLRMRYWAHG